MNTAAVAEEICDVGYYSAAGATVCTACEAGKFALFDEHWCNLIGCLSCNSGYTTTSSATVAANGEVENEKDSICVCALGYGRETRWRRFTSCTICSPGYFSGSTDDSSCNECGSGFYQGSSGSSSCEPCPAGKYMETSYKTEIDQGQCLDCQTPEYTSNEGTASDSATTIGKCYCSRGYFRNGSNVCVACIAGEYKISAGDATSCSTCPAGRYMLHTFSAQTSNENCVECVAGRYSKW